MCNLVSTQREDFRLQEGWAGMPNPSNWYVISIFCSFSADYSRFQVFFTCCDGFGRSKDTRGYRRGGLTCPPLQNSNWYVISIFCSFFVHFLLIVRDFRRFSGVMMHLEGLRTKEVQEGWTDMPTPPKWYVFRFFGHFFADCS